MNSATIDKKFLTEYKIPTGRNYGKSYEEIFHNSYIKKTTGCWEWNKWMYSNGYGGLPISNKKPLAHRISYILHNDKDIKNLCICHKCDNKKCVNPEHLFLGTHKDNYEDMIKKERDNAARGERSGKTSLTNQEVLEMRKEYLSGLSINELSKKYKILYNSCYRIVTYRRWT